MRVFFKKTHILVLITIIIIVCLTGIYNYKKPIAIHKAFNEAIVTQAGSEEILKKTTI